MIVSNIVKKSDLNKVQLKTLNILKEALINSFGPMGSNTLIKRMAGSNTYESVPNKYTKDGFTIMQNIFFNGPVEAAIKEDILESTRYVVRTVGDGTTSTVILSAIIFAKILGYTDKNGLSLFDKFAPSKIVNTIKEIVKECSDVIKDRYKEPTLDDIYNIALISTNGNEALANAIKEIYKEYGMQVFIDVSVSSSVDSYTKAYDGMTLDSGFDDPCYINVNGKQYSSIKDAKIYAFRDPIDTPEMTALFDAIISKNVIKPLVELNSKISKGKQPTNVQPYVPTVILAPRISSDMSNYLVQLVEMIRKAPTNDSKPPFVIISNIYNMDQYEDIVYMTGARYITKYIDPDIQKRDIEKGLAPTPETVDMFAGGAEVVITDANKTKFIKPAQMFKADGTYSDIYNQHMAYLTDTLNEAYNTGKDANVTGNLKRRINSLKSNMVEYFVGGITVADRDSDRFLIEDAVLNCRSAATKGVGYGANFEGLRAINKLLDILLNDAIPDDETINTDYILKLILTRIIRDAYYNLATILYGTSIKDNEKVNKIINDSLLEENDCPYNIRTELFDKKVLSSLDTDIIVLETIAKILSIVVTANQALIPSPQYNTYSDPEK